MADNKGKTKAAILHELESIKGLLLEDDEIPILQEAIVDDEHEFDPPLPKRDLDELHDVFQALSTNIESKPEPASTAAAVRDPETSPPSRTEAAGKQGSLFGESRSETDAGTRTFATSTARNSNDDAAGVKRDARGLNRPLNYAVNKPITPPRPTLAKASGENPFLPQHIRARLHGNNPPPLFDEFAEKTPASVTSKPTSESVNRQQLIHEVVAAVLPDVEEELRQRLQALTDEQLQQFLEDRE